MTAPESSSSLELAGSGLTKLAADPANMSGWIGGVGSVRPMDHADPASVEQSIVDSWPLPGPIQVTTGVDAGTTSDVFAVRDGLDRQFIAKLVYDSADRVEVGLRAAEAVQTRTGLATGLPIRSTAGSLTVSTDSVHSLQHPLALLTRLLGPTVRASSRPADAGRLLAGVHQALLDVEVDTGDAIVGYLLDDTAEYRGCELINAAVRHVADEVSASDRLTWGLCYGDGPELIEVDGALGLIDWGAVTRTVLLWDVGVWAASIADRDLFVSSYSQYGGPAAAELGDLPVMARLAAAHRLRFRAHRVVNADHYDETIDEDRAAVTEAAAVLGLDARRTLAALEA